MTRGMGGPLARVLDGGAVAGLTDGQLLDRFATRRGDAAEAAFEALVRRHGPMVARVCRSCLRDEHDVEDALQATFLVLVRRADSLGERDRLAPWLYGVAHRVARKARAVAARRRGREGGRAGADPPARLDPSARVGVELAPVLHEEVDRLPAKYREPIILCHLQGLTHAEAARELAWPVGTVSVRLARARKLLADRLARRGVTASAALVASALAGEASAAGVLAPSTIAAVSAAAVAAAGGLTLLAGPAAVSAGAASLARRTSMTLLVSPLKWLAAPAVALLTAAGATLVSTRGPGPDPAAPPQTAALPPPIVVAPVPADLAMPAPAAPRAVNPFLDRIEVMGPAQVSDAQLPSESLEGKALLVHGRVAGLPQLVEQLRGSDPQARFRIELTGEPIRFQSTDPAAVRPALTAPRGQAVGPPGEKVSSAAPKVGVGPVVADLPTVVEREDGSLELGPIPPAYFNLAPTDPEKPGSPRPVRIGQSIVVEVVEALPGRPISGRRLVRNDGTISLEFYGDLHVAGLNRDQIKVKVVEHLLKYLSENVLGLIGFKGDKPVAIRPLDTNRVYVDDQPKPDHDARFSRQPDGPVPPADAAVARLSGQVADLSSKLDRALGAIEQMRREQAAPPPK